MIELGWTLLVVLVLGAASATVLVPWLALLNAGQSLMLFSAALGIPLELMYYALLGYLLGRGRTRPKGWQWRSFDHHRALSKNERRMVMPLFYAGALAFIVSGIGIAMAVLAFVAAWRQR
jgi:Kef-type K+ transport system membrane component KefB